MSNRNTENRIEKKCKETYGVLLQKKKEKKLPARDLLTSDWWRVKT
jgi:hypothetical protein